MARPSVSGAQHLVDATLHRIEPVAPAWLVRVVAPKKAPVPWPDMIRTAVAIGVPLAVGMLIGRPDLAAFAAQGALLGAFGDAGGPFRKRAARIAQGAAAGIAGLLIGRVLLEAGFAAIPVVGLVGVVSAFLSGISAELSFAGLQLLVYVAVASGIGRAASPGVLAGGFVVGAAFATLLSFVQTRLLPRRPGGPRAAVTAVIDALLDLLHGIADGRDEDDYRSHRRALTAAVGAAYDAVASARARSSGRRDDLRRTSATLAAVTRLAAVSAARDGTVEAARALPALESLRNRIASGQRHVIRAVPTAELARTPAGARIAAALEQVERVASGRISAAVDPGRPVRRRSIGDLVGGPKTWLFAARLSLTLMVAETVRQLLPLEKPYWVLLTAAIVLKPDFGSVFARGLQRTLGTLIGVLIGAGILVAVPSGPLLLLPVVLLALLFPLGASRNYGMLATFITPLVLILIAISGVGTRGVALDRLLDTLIGAAVVLLVGYLPWPSTWRPRLGLRVAAATSDLADYAAVAIGEPSSVTAPARRRAYRTLSDARSDLQSALAEPGPRSRDAAAWWPLIAQLEQTADDLRDASIIGARVATDHDPAETEQVVAALRDLRDAIRDHRSPAELPLPEHGILADAAGDVGGVRRLVTGPPA